MKVFIVALLAFTMTGCGFKHAFHITTDEDVLDKLGYAGENRAVYRIGDQKCYTNDDQKPFPQADLRCY